MKRQIADLGKITLGTFLMAVAVNFVYEPMGMVTGGISGLGIVIKELTTAGIPGGIPVWISNIGINLPIFLWAYFVKGKRFLCFTFLANIMFTVFLGILPIVPLKERDYVLSAVMGGVLTGAGLGIVFATGYSTGGTDLLGSILHEKNKRFPVAAILFTVDALIILAGMFVFGIFTGVYAMIAVFISSKIMDEILSGLKVGKQVWVISEQYQKISEEIMQRMGRGVTCLEGYGMYSGSKKRVLLCVLGKREVIPVVQLIRKIDASAFLILQDAREVMGEGFQKIE